MSWLLLLALFFRIQSAFAGTYACVYVCSDWYEDGYLGGACIDAQQYPGGCPVITDTMSDPVFLQACPSGQSSSWNPDEGTSVDQEFFLADGLKECENYVTKVHKNAGSYIDQCCSQTPYPDDCDPISSGCIAQFKSFRLTGWQTAYCLIDKSAHEGNVTQVCRQYVNASTVEASTKSLSDPTSCATYMEDPQCLFIDYCVAALQVACSYLQQCQDGQPGGIGINPGCQCCWSFTDFPNQGEVCTQAICDGRVV